ncbi:MAG TPA: PAS domain-containing protein, partial [Dongiaceae bacterium]
MLLELDADTRQWIAENPDRRWALLLGYWNRLAEASGRMPGRAEIDPLNLAVELLPNIFLVDVVRDAGRTAPRFRFRLLGTAITARETVKPGQYLDENPPSKAIDEMTRQYLACLDR